MKRLFGYLNTFGCKLIIPKLIIFKFFFKTIFVLSTHPQIESDFILTPQTSTTSFKVLQIIPWVQLVRKQQESNVSQQFLDASLHNYKRVGPAIRVSECLLCLFKKHSWHPHGKVPPSSASRKKKSLGDKVLQNGEKFCSSAHPSTPQKPEPGQGRSKPSHGRPEPGRSMLGPGLGFPVPG